MNNDPRMYGNGLNPEVLKDVKNLNEKIEKTTDKNEQLKLRMQRLYRGMEFNTGLNHRTWGGYYPY